VSQPQDRRASIPAPGKVDASLGEFWVENPWEIVTRGHNLSAYERNRVYFNVPGPGGGRDFLDVSHLSGADSDGDGRSVVAADFRNNGKQDLVVRQTGGGALLLYENNLPTGNYLKVSLRGRKSNRLGIGARLTARVRGQNLVREMYPFNSFQSQMPNLVHFGLGKAPTVKQLTILWPSGQKQVLTDLAGNRHIVVTEGAKGPGAVRTVRPGEVIPP
jgi:hypothetical protein